MELAAMYEGLRQELAFNPNWVVRVESQNTPSGMVPVHPDCWQDLPTPQAELYYQPYPNRMDDFVREQGGFNCAANHDTFDKWWPLHELQKGEGWNLQITVIDLSASPHLKLPKQTLIKRDSCTVVKTILLH